MIAEEIEKLVEGVENVEKVEVNSSTLRQDDTQIIPSTRLKPRSNKESPEVEITIEVQPVNINEKEEESTEDDYELKRRDKGKHKLTKTDPKPSSSTPSSCSSKSNITATNGLLSLFKPKLGCFKRYRSFFDELQGRYSYLFDYLKTRFMPRKKFNVLAQHLQEIMKELLPTMVDDQVKELTKKQSKRQKTSEHRTFMFGESSSGQDFKSKQGPSMSGNQEQLDDFDFCTDSYATDYDEIPNEKVSQELVDEMSHTVDEAKLHKVESRKVIIDTPHPQSPTLLVQRGQRDPKAPVLSLINQDLLYLKKGSTGPEKIVRSLHKFPVVIFPDDDIEERTSRWVEKCVKKFNPYARYNVEHWKNSHAEIFYIKKQKEHRKPKEIIVRRANGSIVSITESDYKNLNKNDIEDMYLLIVHKVDDYAETGLLWSLSVFMRSTVIWERVHDFQLGVESYQHKVNLTEPTITFPESLEGLKSYNNDVKLGYVSQSHSNEDVEYLQLFEEEIEERLKHRDQMRRWEMYVNGRPLGSRRERPE
ncbi:hypothetical protein Tco_0740234 [Tanacetum coccineum]